MNINLDRAVFYHDDKFPPKILDIAGLLTTLLAATDALARYDQMIQGLQNSEIFLAPLRGQESLASSRMEGTFSTMEEILELEAQGEGTLGSEKSFRSEAVETYLYGRSLKNAQLSMEEGRPLSKSLIKEMHGLLLASGRGAEKSPGAFKDKQNYVGDPGSSLIRFVPVTPEKLDSGMDILMNFLQTSSLPPLLRVALSHVEFEALHPFKDGNGRIGRMLITLMLWHFGVISQPHFYISRYFEKHKDQYIERMREVSKSDDWSGWCNFFLEAVREQALQNLDVANSIVSLYEEMKLRFNDLLVSRWSTQTLDYIYKHPVFRNNHFTNSSGIPKQTAARISRKLLQEKLIVTQREASGQASAVYRFEPLLRLVRNQ